MKTLNHIEAAERARDAAAIEAGNRQAADHLNVLVERESEHSDEAQIRNLANAAEIHDQAVAREEAADRRRLEAKRASEKAEHEAWQREVEARVSQVRVGQRAEIANAGGPFVFAFQKINGAHIAGAVAEERIAALEARIAALEAAINNR